MGREPAASARRASSARSSSRWASVPDVAAARRLRKASGIASSASKSLARTRRPSRARPVPWRSSTCAMSSRARSLRPFPSNQRARSVTERASKALSRPRRRASIRESATASARRAKATRAREEGDFAGSATNASRTEKAPPASPWSPFRSERTRRRVSSGSAFAPRSASSASFSFPAFSRARIHSSTYAASDGKRAARSALRASGSASVGSASAQPIRSVATERRSVSGASEAIADFAAENAKGQRR